jgi:threonine dehydratase
VDDILLVDEEAISRAISYANHVYGETIEGSAAVGLAAILTGAIKPPAVVVISGGNIPPELHAQVCSRFKELE